MANNPSSDQKQSRPDPAVADPDKDLVSTAGQGQQSDKQQSGSQQSGSQQSDQERQQRQGQSQDNSIDKQRGNR